MPDTEWTLETLRIHLSSTLAETDKRNEQRFQAQEKAVMAALVAAEKAVAKAEIAAEKRFDAVNEFRGQLTDQAATFMPRLESEHRHSQAAEKIADLEQRLTENLASVNSRLDLTSGKNTGYSTVWAILVSAAVIAVALYNALHK